MKKATRLFAALVALSLTAATLAACSSDEDTRRTEQTSTWKNTNRDGMRDQNRTYSRSSQK